MIAAAKLMVRGRVQGVWYRASAKDEAVRLALLGWVRNTPDGSVEVFAEGPKDKVEALIRWCQSGPPLAKVSEVEVEWTEPTGRFNRFEVRY